jgi:hypothetical protein
VKWKETDPIGKICSKNGHISWIAKKAFDAGAKRDTVIVFFRKRLRSRTKKEDENEKNVLTVSVA